MGETTSSSNIEVRDGNGHRCAPSQVGELVYRPRMLTGKVKKNALRAQGLTDDTFDHVAAGITVQRQAEERNVMKIGCVGAGFIGRAVAKLAVEHGHQVMLSNSRAPRTLTSTAIAVRAGIGTVADAVAFGDVVLLAIPFYAVADLDPAPFVGKIVMDACNYYPGRDEPVPELDSGATTTSEIVQRHLAGAKVVKAWNAILERDIEKDARSAGTPERRALPIAGDDAETKANVVTLFEDLGYDVVDAGPLREGWRFERARPAYCVPLDRAGLEAKLAEAGAGQQIEGAWRAA